MAIRTSNQITITDLNDGKGIVNTVVEYQNHTSGSVAPTGTWINTVPSPVKGGYLWTRTTTTYTDESTVVTYSVSYLATDGQSGKGISSTVVRYQISASGTVTPTGVWDETIPEPIKGQYLWTRTTITYTDSTTSVSYSTSYYATDGQKGDKGDKGSTGNDGRSITKVDVWYYLSTSATALSGGTWATTAPTWVDGRFMWSKTVTTYSSGLPTESTPACITGSKGATGNTGSTGNTGATGKGITSITEEYAISTSKTTAPSNEAFSITQPTWESGKYIWTRSEIVYTNPASTEYTIPFCDSSWEAVNEIEIGGRNLLRNSDFSKGILYWTGDITSLTAKVVDNVLELVFDKSVSQKRLYYPGLNLSSYGTDITISVDIKADEVDILHMGQSGNTRPVNVGTEWARRSITLPYATLNQYTFGFYYTGASATNKFYIDNVKLEKGNKATDWTPAPEDIQEQFSTLDTSITNVNGALTNFQTTVNSTFKDGIIQEAEAKSIAQYLNTLNVEKLGLDNRYTTIYGNTNLTGTAKTNLSSAKTAYNTAHQNLISAIDLAIEDGKASATEKANVDSKFISYKTALGTLSTRLEEAVKAIETKMVGDVNSKVTTNTTALNVQQGKINTIISESAIDELNGEGVTLYDKYTTTEQTLDGITSTVGEHTSVLQDISLKDKDVQNGNPVMTTLSEDAVVHVGIDCTNLQAGESLTSFDIVVSDGNPDAPLPEDIEYGILINGVYKVNILSSEPLQYGDKIFIDLDGLWKRQDNVGETTIEILPEELQTKLNNIPSFSSETHVYTIANVTPNLNCTFKSSGWYELYKTKVLLDNKTDRGYVDSLINNTTMVTQTQIRQTQDSITADLDKKISDLNGDITQSYSADIQATVDNFSLSFSNIQSIIENNNQSVTDLNQHFDFSTGGMEIGKTGSPLKINIDNEEMQFKDSEAVVAYINGLKMYISNLDIVDSLEVGNHKIEKFNNEITIVRFIG